MRPRKNPLLRTTHPLLPPGASSRAAHLLTAAAAEGRFVLPCCSDCGRFLWPMHEACPSCLGAVGAAPAPQTATVLAATTAEVPADPYFRERAPWHTGLVHCDCGPSALVHLHPDLKQGDRAHLRLMLDRAGRAVLHAAPKGADMTIDRAWQEMTANPKDRRILITDARHIAAIPLARALAKAGAAAIFAGLPEAWKPFPGRAALEEIEGVQIVDLDVTSDRSVEDLARRIGGKVEILINTADLPRPGGLYTPAAPAEARAAMETVAFGLMRLSRAFGPAMTSRGADGPNGAVAWVNLLSVFARAHPPALAGYAAAHAAALALSQALRAELGTGGIRLMTVLSGPTEDDWFQRFPAPKPGGKALAMAIVTALMNGQEDIVVGDLAQDLVQRLGENPKAVERDLAGGRF